MDLSTRDTEGTSTAAVFWLFSNEVLTLELACCQAVGRAALLHFLKSNPAVVDVCIDQCYSPDAAVAQTYFQVRDPSWWEELFR